MSKRRKKKHKSLKTRIIKGLRDLDKYVFINIVLATLKMKCANHGSFYLNLEEIIIKVKFDYLHENFNIVYMEQEHIITNVKKLCL
jgi:hypothetical protein